MSQKNVHLTSFSRSWSRFTPRDETHHCCVSSSSSPSSEQLLPPFCPTAFSLKHNKEHPSLFPCLPVGPILLVEPQPKTVDVDSDVTLNCKWAGNPPLTLTWFKKGSNTVSSERAHVFLCPVYKSSHVFPPLSLAASSFSHLTFPCLLCFIHLFKWDYFHKVQRHVVLLNSTGATDSGNVREPRCRKKLRDTRRLIPSSYT